MDKLFEKKWFIKVSSITIAVLLFLMVNADTTTINTGGIPGITDGSRVIEEAELNVYFDEENYVLAEAPETVQATLRGPQNVLTFSQVTEGQQEFYVDLTDHEPGVHYERVEHRGFPADLSISIVPMTVRIVIQEQQTASFPVDVDIVNEGLIAEGYVLGEPEIDPSTVDVRAGQGTIEQIAQAKAVIDVEAVNEDITGSFPVAFVDENGTELELTANPAAVDILIPITAPNKSVPVQAEREGSLADGMVIDSIDFSPSEVDVFGPVDVINDIDIINVAAIDLSTVDGSVVIEREVMVPEGVESVEPETIQVTINIEEESERVFDDFEIDVENASDEQEVTFVQPENGMFDLTIGGSETLLERLVRDDLQASIDVEGLEDGEHDLTVNFDGPQHIQFLDEGLTVAVEISNGQTASISESDNDNSSDDESDEEEPNDSDTS
ncbi:CdaR family protein [Salisediminibacterium beveridgei]|uniref:YbbR domain-containing protein n=1 Tax=Salisediminibacterium beveridgei TaxID=632773 RepID=A0A1D7QZ62_9BACI|nr:CdaR family protein [Salisediminibacterium beveridgei]AOM84291.1 hypothetical protein BBEV_2966 [Salisediminibacterium beveridgei]